MNEFRWEDLAEYLEETFSPKQKYTWVSLKKFILHVTSLKVFLLVRACCKCWIYFVLISLPFIFLCERICTLLRLTRFRCNSCRCCFRLVFREKVAFSFTCHNVEWLWEGRAVDCTWHFSLTLTHNTQTALRFVHFAPISAGRREATLSRTRCNVVEAPFFASAFITWVSRVSPRSEYPQRTLGLEEKENFFPLHTHTCRIKVGSLIDLGIW